MPRLIGRDRFGKINMEEAIKTTPEHIKLCDKDSNLKVEHEGDAKDSCERSHKRFQGHDHLASSNLDKTKQLLKGLSPKLFSSMRVVTRTSEGEKLIVKG